MCIPPAIPPPPTPNTARRGVQTYANVPRWDMQVCLQEVMFSAYDSELLPALTAHGYRGLMQNSRKRSATHPQGVATFWKTARFELRAEYSRSRTLTAVLRDAGASAAAGCERQIAVVNVHLEGSPSAAITRVKQLQGALKELQQGQVSTTRMNILYFVQHWRFSYDHTGCRSRTTGSCSAVTLTASWLHQLAPRGSPWARYCQARWIWGG